MGQLEQTKDSNCSRCRDLLGQIWKVWVLCRLTGTEEKRREPGWVVPPSVVVSGACSEVELDYEKAAIPAGQQRSMVSVPGVCATLKLKVPTVGPAVVNVRDRAMGEINWKKRELANEVPGAKEVELTGSVGFCSELIVKYMSDKQSSKDAGKHVDHNDTTRNWTRYEP